MFCAGIQIKMYLYFDISISQTKTLYIDWVIRLNNIIFLIFFIMMHLKWKRIQVLEKKSELQMHFIS